MKDNPNISYTHCKKTGEGISKFHWILQTFGAKELKIFQLTIEVVEQSPVGEDLDLLAIPELVNLSQLRKLPKVGREGDWESRSQTDNGQTVSVILL